MRQTRRTAAYRGLQWALLAWLVGSASPARAEEGQWLAGGRLGGAWLQASGLGPSLEVFARRGATHSLDLDMQLTASLHPLSNSAGPLSSWPRALCAAPGITYRWDVLRTVPYVGIGLGFYAMGSVKSQLKTAAFGAPLRLGVDYLLSRDVVLSAQGTAHLIATNTGVGLPWFQFGIGASHAWGW